ncbi:unnamed protein product [Cuscuta europaea]|uniref:Vesicle transport protein n=1 Tax=Cuscuta europaea TaxID=41803 RepID=A0A9P0YH49_CUSEU|nr:unnamed protein product [Cuscuta europaea]
MMTKTLRWVSQGVGDLPGNSPSATSNVPSGKALMYFELFLGAGVFFIFLAFTMFLPVMVIMPQKFAIGFTIGCSFIIGSFFALQRSKKSTFTHAIKGEASVYSQFHWQHGGDNIFFNGHEELYSLCENKTV